MTSNSPHYHRLILQIHHRHYRCKYLYWTCSSVKAFPLLLLIMNLISSSGKYLMWMNIDFVITRFCTWKWFSICHKTFFWRQIFCVILFFCTANCFLIVFRDEKKSNYFSKVEDKQEEGKSEERSTKIFHLWAKDFLVRADGNESKTRNLFRIFVCEKERERKRVFPCTTQHTTLKFTTTQIFLFSTQHTNS